MNKLLQLSPQVPLRIGLALTYLYSGFGMIITPSDWSWYIPEWVLGIVNQLVSTDTYLRMQGGMEVALALVMLAWFLKPKVVTVAATIGALHMLGILLAVGIDPSTFRDFAILGGWLCLVLLSANRTQANENQ